MKDKYWIQNAVEHTGRVRAYLKRMYGNKAFFNKGTLKMTYLYDAYKKAKDPNLKKAILLAIRLKTMRR